MEPFADFKKVYLESRITMPYERYKLAIFLIPAIISANITAVTFLLIHYYGLSTYILLFPAFVFVCAVFLMIYYPYDKRAQRQSSIDANLPYALNYMASISETGVAPVAMFESIASFDVYGEVSKEAAMIVKQTQILGKDVLSVLEDQAVRTPSESFREVLNSLISVLHAGGDVSSYLRQKYNDVMFKRILRENEYEKSLDVYEDVFTTLLVVTPLLFLIFVMLGEILSPGYLNAMFLLKLFVYVFLPIANIVFIMVMKMFRKE